MKNYNKNKYSEANTRKKLMRYAEMIGADEDLNQLFKKWDMILLTIPAKEKVEASRMAILELQSLLDIHAEEGEGLTINGQEIIPASEKELKKLK